MDKNSVKELLVQTGTSEGDKEWNVYTITNGTCELVGKFSGWHSVLYVCSDGGVYNRQAGSGYEEIYKIVMQNGKLDETLVSEKQLGADEEYSKPGEVLEYRYVNDLELLK